MENEIKISVSGSVIYKAVKNLLNNEKSYLYEKIESIVLQLITEKRLEAIVSHVIEKRAVDSIKVPLYLERFLQDKVDKAISKTMDRQVFTQDDVDKLVRKSIKKILD